MAAVSSTWTCSFIFEKHGLVMVIQSVGMLAGLTVPENRESGTG